MIFLSFSYKTLALGWTGLAGAAAVAAGVLQATYVPPAAPAPAPVAIQAPPAPAPALAAAPVPLPAAVPFENRSLLAMLPPPDIRPRPAPHAAPAEPLPVPPVPPVRVAQAEPPRHVAPAPRNPAPEPAYAAAAPAYPGWDWGRRLPYPGQYAASRAYYYSPQPPYYGWQPD